MPLVFLMCLKSRRRLNQS